MKREAEFLKRRLRGEMDRLMLELPRDLDAAAVAYIKLPKKRREFLRCLGQKVAESSE